MSAASIFTGSRFPFEDWSETLPKDLDLTPYTPESIRTLSWFGGDTYTESIPWVDLEDLNQAGSLPHLIDELQHTEDGSDLVDAITSKLEEGHR